MRWEDRLAALLARRELLVEEILRRGYRHTSPLDPSLAVGDATQAAFADPPQRQLELLAAKPCACPLPHH